VWVRQPFFKKPSGNLDGLKMFDFSPEILIPHFGLLYVFNQWFDMGCVFLMAINRCICHFFGPLINQLELVQFRVGVTYKSG
jgi:hypothetical protein